MATATGAGTFCLALEQWSRGYRSAQLERQQISARISEKAEWRARKGLSNGGQILGYEMTLVLLLLAGIAYALVRRPVLGFAGAWFFVVLSPTSGFVPILSEVAAERLVYLPSMALAAVAVTLVWLALRHLERRRLAPALLLASVAALMTLTMIRSEDFFSAESIWRTALAARPDNVRAHVGLGRALAEDRPTA